MSETSHGRRAAHRADRMNAKKPGERTGSRPKPPEAGARSASLEPGRAPGYRQTSQLLLREAGKVPRSGGWGVESSYVSMQVCGDGRAIRLGPKQRATPHPRGLSEMCEHSRC